MDQLFPGVWRDRKRVLTKNLTPGSRGFSEELVRVKKGPGSLSAAGGSRGPGSLPAGEYRVWDPNKSKLCAALVRGLKNFPIKEGSKMLYLGIANGQTASYLSDIIGKEGVIYGVEISERSIRDLNHLAERRGNIIPILGDARKPQDYSWIERVDLVYQDVAAPDQPEILVRNARIFLKPGGFAMLAVKSRSIDVTKKPDMVYREAEKKLRRDFEILEKIRLDPYERDHMFFVLKHLAKG